MSVASIALGRSSAFFPLSKISPSSFPAKANHFFSQTFPLTFPSGEFWQTKLIAPLGDFVSALPDYLMGGMWGGLVLMNGASLCVHGAEYGKIQTESPLTEDVKHRINKAWCRVAKDLTQLAGALAHLTEWVHQMKWTNIGTLGPLFKSVGYGGAMLGSGIEIFSRTQDLISLNERMGKKNSDIKKEKMYEHQRHCWLEIVVHASMIAWASLGLLGLVVHSPVITTLFLVTLAVSMPLFFLSACYKKDLEAAHGKEAPNEKCCVIYL